MAAGSVLGFVGFGSNVDPELNVPAALRALAGVVTVEAVSAVYRTAALHRPNDPPFANGVCAIRTDLPAATLKQGVLAGIEDGLGRQRTDDPYAPRVIDLDLLLLGQETSADPPLPHPDLEREFVALPLLEVAPDLVLPDGERLDAFVADRLGDGASPGQRDKDLTACLAAILEQSE